MCLTEYKNNAQTYLNLKLFARLISGLCFGQSLAPARTFFIRIPRSNSRILMIFFKLQIVA